jgi:beta-lactamase class A
MDIDRAVVLIGSALQSPNQRSVNLTIESTAAGRPSLETLQILLKQIIDLSGFDGLVDLYFLDLQKQETIHFAYQAGQDFSVIPDIAFSGASTIKIPILISIFRHFESQIPPDIDTQLKGMIATSSNEEADGLMALLDPIRGPLVVTETMQQLGLNSTFISMYFKLGSIPLQHYKTPGNSRPDINTNPDPFVQTTPVEIGMLLEDIYLCAQNGGGSLVAAFPGEINQAGCQKMLDILKIDKPVMLIKAGVPEGVAIANKYGYVSDKNGIINDVSDAGIVYTQGGDYVLTIYANHPIQVLWNTVSPMFAELSRAVYNYFNLSSQ